MPSSSTLFLVSHADGTIIVYDKERDDGTFTPQDPTSPAHENGGTPVSDEPSPAKEWDPMDNIFVTMPPWHPATGNPSIPGKSEKDKVAKNPVSHWRISKRGVVGMPAVPHSVQRNFNLSPDFVFSPDVKYVAAISEDGCLRVIDALAEQ